MQRCLTDCSGNGTSGDVGKIVTGPTYQRSRRPTITCAMTRPGICHSPRHAPQPADPYPGRPLPRPTPTPADPPVVATLRTRQGAATRSATSTNNLAPGQAPSTLTPPEKRHAELDRILDMIAKPLTPRSGNEPTDVGEARGGRAGL